MLAEGACEGFWTFFLPLFYTAVWETAQYRMNYCFKGLLNPKQLNWPTAGEKTAEKVPAFSILYLLQTQPALALLL